MPTIVIPPQPSPHKVLFVNVKWSNTGADPWKPSFTTTLAQQVSAWYVAASYGKAPMQIACTPFVTADHDDSGGAEAYATLMQLPTLAKIRALGFEPAEYGRIVFGAPRPVGIGFKGWNNGSTSYIFCMNSDYAKHATIHELGHSYGLGHTLTLRVGTRAGPVLTIPGVDTTTGGSVVALYDDSTAMGYTATAGNFTAAEKSRLGWITLENYPGGDRTYQITAMSVDGGALYGVRIGLGMVKSTSVRQLYVEYRDGSGMDSKIPVGHRGVQIRQVGDFACPTPALVDAHPESNTASDSAFQVGETFTDGSLAIDVLGPGLIRVRNFAEPVIVPPPPPTPIPAPIPEPAPTPTPVPTPPPVAPPSSGISWHILAPDMTEHIDETGTKWRSRDYVGTRMALLRNGVYENKAVIEAYYPGTGPSVYAKWPDGVTWSWWNGTAWSYMKAGEIPPGY